MKTNRRSFLKSSLIGTFLLQQPYSVFQTEEFSFDQLFKVWPKNEILIHPQPRSEFYQKIESILKNNIGKRGRGSYMGEYEILLPIKESYTWNDLEPIINYFQESVRKNRKFSHYGEVIPVVFRMIKRKNGVMNLDVFMNSFS